VLHVGAIPIFADVDPETGLMRPEDAAPLVTDKTRAIMPVHVHGCAFDVAGFLELCKVKKLDLIEDAAQAHGATFDGRPVGALGKAGGFSLQSSKNLGIGEGGVFVTNDDAIAEAANRIRNFGQNIGLEGKAGFDPRRPLDGHKPMESQRIGWMYRGNEMAAAFARAALAKLPERTALAQKNAERLSARLAELPGVLPQPAPKGGTTVHHKYRVRLDPKRAGLPLSPRVLRDAMIAALRAEGLEVVLWQVAPLPAQSVFQTREGFGRAHGQTTGDGWPWSMDRATDFASLYAPARFGNTQALLDGSLLLFSQTCPLIAQPASVVDAYADAFAKVWHRRDALVGWAEKQGLTDRAR
jgi:dTDP-4-amino-4,6-dideoxygalactose transaminase